MQQVWTQPIFWQASKGRAHDFSWQELLVTKIDSLTSWLGQSSLEFPREFRGAACTLAHPKIGGHLRRLFCLAEATSQRFDG
jgi:hypothetical protein